VKSRFDKQLSQELRAAGAAPDETQPLLRMAGRLAKLQSAAQSQPHPWRALAPVGMTLLVGLLGGALLVGSAQASLPGNWLYPVKKTSDQVAVKLRPDYRGVIMMQRAQAVQKLVSNHASQATVVATLADYQQQALAYKTSSSNYSVFEFCKANLQQAERGATGSEQQAIRQTLASLNDV
jgi:hypothetical protein